jgi:putative protein-disulfide isomerase
MNGVLYYIGDPMCSWCWGFAPVLERVRAAIPEEVRLRYVMGGLAADTNEPMPEDVRAYVQGAWRAVSEQTGALFNWDFWNRCRPRRSTYPACRGVLCAAAQREEAGPLYFEAVQRAYYTEARNPSEPETLVALSREIGLDADRFALDLVSPETERRLQEDFTLRRRLGVRQFPTLVLGRETGYTPLVVGYMDAEPVMERLAAAMG